MSFFAAHKSVIILTSLMAVGTATFALVVAQRRRRLLAGNKIKNGVLQYVLDYKTSKEKTNAGLCYAARALCPDYFADLIDEQIIVEQIQGGITNLLWKITNEKNQACLVRVYGQNTEIMIDRDKECMIFAELSKRKFGPKLWGRFLNGRVEGYFNGKPFDPPDKMGQRSPVDFPVLIAQELARMHDIKGMPVPQETQLWIMLDRFYKLATGIIFNRDEVKNRQLLHLDLPQYAAELKWLQTVLPSPLNGHGKTLPISEKARSIAFRQVFSHNDLLSGNILFLAAEGRCQYIDFEYGAYNYAAFDVADHFCEYAGFDFDLVRWYPQDDLQMHFWKAYIIAAGFKLDAAEEDALLSELVLWTNKFALTAHLLWFFWAIIQAKHSVIDVDFMGYAARRRDGYAMHKRQFFSVQ